MGGSGYARLLGGMQLKVSQLIHPISEGGGKINKWENIEMSCSLIIVLFKKIQEVNAAVNFQQHIQALGGFRPPLLDLLLFKLHGSEGGGREVQAADQIAKGGGEGQMPCPSLNETLLNYY